MKSLKAFVAEASTCIDLIWANAHRIFPMWHVIDNKGRNSIFPPPPCSKDQAGVILRGLFREKKIVRCLYIDEAWKLEMTGDETKARAEIAEYYRMHSSLEGYPDRVEIVTFQAEDLEEGMLGAERVISRGCSDAPVLRELKFIEGAVCEGRMVGMLDHGRGMTKQ